MTRINCVPVQELSTKHLVAEYRELPRVFRLAEKAWLRGYVLDPSAHYTLGTGHVKLFYDKLGWCEKRFHELRTEMLQRGYKPSYAEVPKVSVPGSWRQDWVPTAKALQINRERIAERLQVRV